MGGPPRSRGRRGFGVFWSMGLALVLSLPHRHFWVGTLLSGTIFHPRSSCSAWECIGVDQCRTTGLSKIQPKSRNHANYMR